MMRERSYALYVNLSASQVRKRLRGYGFGVRRVEAADRNQAVIVHTATGGHLRDLRSLFADVLVSTSPQALGTPLENLRNLGPSSASWLREIGVRSRADLEQVGPVLAYQLVKRKQPSINVNFLWALAAALGDQDIGELSDSEKAKLRTEAEGSKPR